MESAKEAKQIILQDNESARVDIMKLDLCSVKSVRSFVENFLALDLPLNILMYVHHPLLFILTVFYQLTNTKAEVIIKTVSNSYHGVDTLVYSK